MKAPLIVKWRYWENKNNTGRSANYIKYIGTRDHVEIPEEKSFLDYMGTRPRAEKQGHHGLFSDDGFVLDLKTEREKLKEHDGKVFTLIFSLSREDAESTGFNCAEQWRSLMRIQKFEIAKQFGIPPEHLKWYGAFHNEATHPHIHVLLYSDDSAQEGYLTRQGLKKIKSSFATEVFRHELDGLYTMQTEQRDELTALAREELSELIEKIQNHSCDDPKLVFLMQELSEKLKSVKGRKAYGYLSKELKALVDEITDTLTENKEIKKLYDLWYESKYAILKIYTAHIPIQKPLSEEETFKPIRNAVIQEASKLSNETGASVFSSEDHNKVSVGAVTKLMRSVSKLFEDQINRQQKQNMGNAVDSRMRREIEAKKLGIILKM